MYKPFESTPQADQGRWMENMRDALEEILTLEKKDFMRVLKLASEAFIRTKPTGSSKR